jgi:hypothetical protein
MSRTTIVSSQGRRNLNIMSTTIEWFVGDPAPRRDEFDDTDWQRGYDAPDDPCRYLRDLHRSGG